MCEIKIILSDYIKLIKKNGTVLLKIYIFTIKKKKFLHLNRINSK